MTIKSEFERLFGKPPYGIYENYRIPDSEKSARYLIAENAFNLGWHENDKWRDFQNDMDRDYQEELNQQSALERGEA